MTGPESADIISLADKTFKNWKETSFIHRSELMKNAAKVLRDNSEEYSVLMTIEMGKPIVQSRMEVEKCEWVCDYYADNAEKILAEEIIKTEATKSFVSYHPLGVILAVMPWNFPFWQVFRFAAPNLMAGNAGLLKHASNVSGCALAIEDVFRKAGFPENLFRTLLVKSKNVKDIISNTKVQAVTLTGSVPAGKSVAALAGSLIKKTVLELGGSDPYVVLEDADLHQAAMSCVTSRIINGGQSCIAAKRFIIVESVYDEFEKLYLEIMSKKKMGDPLDANNDLGPQASLQLRDELHDQVLRSIKQGAELILGGTVPEIDGAYYPPTILRNVKPGMPAFDEELFGKPMDPEECDLKVYQDLLMFCFIKFNIPHGSKILDIGGGDSRILRYFKNVHECWNIDKLEGVGNGPTDIDTSGFRLVHDYMGNFNDELPENYFDLVFSISTLEHVPLDDEKTYENILKDINRVLKPGGYSVHCIDVVLKEDYVWTNEIMPYFFRNVEMINQFIPLLEILKDPDLFVMSKKYYERTWQITTGKSYEEFGRPGSYNFLWRK